MDSQRRIRANIILLLLVALTLRPAPNAVAQESAAIAFVNVNVIPMDTERVLENQTVIVQGGRIVEIGTTDEIVVPTGAKIVEGNGAYLMPGLADMHVHIDNNPEVLNLFLANGVTTVRNLNSEPPMLAMRDQIASGELLGPTILAGRHLFGMPPPFATVFNRFDRAVGPMFDVNMPAFFGGIGARNPVDGREVTLKAKAEGYDFIKIQWFLTRETFDSIAATAEELGGMPLLGHIPADVGVEHFIRSGAHPEHNYQLVAFIAKDYERQLGANPLDIFDLSEADEKLPELVALMAEEDAAYTPTNTGYVTLDEVFEYIDDLSQAPLFQQPEFRYVPPEIMREWTDSNNEEFQVVMRARGVSDIRDIIPDPAYRDEFIAYTRRQFKALHDGGVPILAGTDSSDLGIIWGFSLHRELEILVEAGLTPYEALEAATRVPAEVVFGNPEEWGTVEVGKRADLLLLSANPLANISHTRNGGDAVRVSAGTPTITRNNFVDNDGSGLTNTALTTVNAPCNWWDAVSGPTHTTSPGGAGQTVSDRVNYEPWLVALAPDSACIGKTLRIYLPEVRQ